MSDIKYVVFNKDKWKIMTIQGGGLDFRRWDQMLTPADLFSCTGVRLASCMIHGGLTDENCEIYLAVISGDGGISLGEQVDPSSV